LKVLREYAKFNGRARRKEYWMFLFNFTIACIIGFISGLIGAILGASENVINLTAATYNLAIIIPSLFVGVRRMHDTGRSGWWILFPLVNLVFLCFEGEHDTNIYGPNPKLS
jgi:uncharacterized membrane protein YhaH (DUF805 family)